ncbi:type II toxin-antitoxin system VapC family toxin [Natronococcus occultus]|uniref:Ribonuclease VapC n=1 Tax=Natronococcus occultus SP4 TaxID=694430 RepID=L0K476_9EURY|nr:PIN domain-containing protein [Natronococcus occultus]AGB39806.1 putative nucleic acid-binding protein, contains PIN domain [Natronococcus occultus SP4]
MTDDPGTTPVFVDTSAWYAIFDEDDARHARATAVREAILAGDLMYRPIYTTSHVLGELATLLLRNSHDAASKALQQIRSSPNVTVIHADRVAFDAAVTEFDRYDDQEISLVDHLTSVLADERNIDRIFAFDGDFRTLGFTVVPKDTGEP